MVHPLLEFVDASPFLDLAVDYNPVGGNLGDDLRGPGFGYLSSNSDEIPHAQLLLPA